MTVAAADIETEGVTVFDMQVECDSMADDDGGVIVGDPYIEFVIELVTDKKALSEDDPETEIMGVFVSDAKDEEVLDGKFEGDDTAEVEGVGVVESKFEPVVVLVIDDKTLGV